MATPKYSYSYANARGSSPEVTQAVSAPALFLVLKLREKSSLDSTDLSWKYYHIDNNNVKWLNVKLH